MGEFACTPAMSMLCQIGRMTLMPETSLLTRPSNSYCGQRLAKKFGLNTTIP
jgi:hypothetical protein